MTSTQQKVRISIQGYKGQPADSQVFDLDRVVKVAEIEKATMGLVKMALDREAEEIIIYLTELKDQ